MVTGAKVVARRATVLAQLKQQKHPGDGAGAGAGMLEPVKEAGGGHGGEDEDEEDGKSAPMLGSTRPGFLSQITSYRLGYNSVSGAGASVSGTGASLAGGGGGEPMRIMVHTWLHKQGHLFHPLEHFTRAAGTLALATAVVKA